MTKLPPLSVLLPPREPFTFHSAADSYSQQHSCCSAVPQHQQHYSHEQQQQHHAMHYPQQQQMHYHQPQQQMHYHHQQQQYPEHYNNCCAQTASVPTSPSSPTWWGASAHTQQQRPAAFAPLSSGSAPFWKNTRGLGEAARRLRDLPYAPTDVTASLPTSLSSSSLSSLASSSSASSSPSASPSKVPAATVVRPKKSRYLREMDRRAIIKRLDAGEKQCALAKEFSVSRSSICNLFKHREEVLSRAAHQSPFSKHPKKCKKQPLAPPRRFA